MEKPFFSIITCTYNSGKYVSKNIESVKKQTYKGFEHIFVDGLSKDKTLIFINNYKKQFSSKVKLIKRKPKGISNAMNEGVTKVSGEYLVILHSDDSFYSKDTLQKVFEYLKVKGFPDWIYGKINVTEENGKSIGVFPSRRIYRFLPSAILKYFSIIPHQAVFIRKSVFKKFGNFDETLSSAMDIDLWLRIFNKTKYKFFDEVISNFTVRKDAQSSSLAKKHENDKNILKVEKRYLNGLEMLIFRFVKLIIDHYSKTRR